ncbi:phage holin family protein [Blastococcus sp. Marseille-P5729]|uniref:phage holin family protein n=1 Tax=Blastococcus sp. Marseille-P5729 TaxID=2086582 RepID=UPI000D0F3643|nr:phage holin family protein [Blastococcus sp. Marseille-P5729]
MTDPQQQRGPAQGYPPPRHGASAPAQQPPSFQQDGPGQHPSATGSTQVHQDLGQPISNVGEIFSNITADISTLVRQETELAKAEIKQSATRAGKGAGLFAGAGVAGHLALIFLSIALWWGIANLIESFGWAALIVGVLWVIAAVVMAMMGRSEMNKIKGLPRTAETASRIPDALKGNEHTNV